MVLPECALTYVVNDPEHAIRVRASKAGLTCLLTRPPRKKGMTSKDFVVTIVARWADIDLNQHMRHSAFADWAAYARTEWLDANGFTILKLLELKMAPIIFEDSTRYLKEIRLGERIHIELQLAGTDRDGSRWFLRHIFRRGATVCAVYEAKGAWLDITTRRIIPAPSGLPKAYSNIARTDDCAELSSGESCHREIAL